MVHRIDRSRTLIAMEREAEAELVEVVAPHDSVRR